MIRIIIIIIFVFYLLKRYNIFKNRAFEVQQDQHPNYKKLKWFQTNSKNGARNTIYFFLRPSDRKNDLLKITLIIPKNFRSKLKKKK